MEYVTFTKHGVVRTDLMDAPDVRATLVSIKYMGDDGETPTEIDNGNVLKVGALMENEREIYIGSAPEADDSIEDIVLIAAPELSYIDEADKNLELHFNLPGCACRGYRMRHGNIFSVTAEALDGTPAVGSTVTLGSGTKLAVDGSGTVVGTIIEEQVLTHYTYYAILVA